MSDAQNANRRADDTDHAFRGILYPKWWLPDEGRVSSLVFNWSSFSVDLESRTSAKASLDRLRHDHDGCGLVKFNCGIAKTLEFIVTPEIDPNHPDNKAHATVKSLARSNSQRKAKAQILTRHSDLVFAPEF